MSAAPLRVDEEPMSGLAIPEDRAARAAWRQRFAQTLGWPTGASLVCVGVERLCPGWSVMFMFAHTGPDGPRPGGFYASRSASWWEAGSSAAYGETAEDLLEEIHEASL